MLCLFFSECISWWCGDQCDDHQNPRLTMAHIMIIYDHLWSTPVSVNISHDHPLSNEFFRDFPGVFFWAPRKICQAKIVGAAHIGLLVVCREKWGLLFQPVVSRTANTCWFFLFIRAVQSLNIATCRCIMASGVGKNLTIWMTLIMLTYVNIYHDPKKIWEVPGYQYHLSISQEAHIGTMCIGVSGLWGADRSRSKFPVRNYRVESVSQSRTSKGSDQRRRIRVNKWVCLKIGYIPNYSHLIGIMIIKHWV